MITVGLTGGIGSGKTTVAALFKYFNIPVFNSDEEAKALYYEPNVKTEIIENFGEELYQDDQLNKEKLIELVFKTNSKRKQLEQILYPALSKKFSAWLKEQNAPYALKEAAVLIEKGTYKDLDKIILVRAREELRIERVMKRNNVSREEVLMRIKSQWTDEKKTSFCDFFIDNNENDSLIKQVVKIHRAILQSIV